MGGPGSGRPPGADALIRQQYEKRTPIAEAGEDVFLPNYSGDHSAGHTTTPTTDLDIANKKYVDDNIGGGGGTGWWTSGSGVFYPLVDLGVSGAYLTTGGTVSGVNVTTGSNPGHTHTFDNITNPDASKTFNFGNNKSLTFSSVDNTPVAGEGTFNFEASGNFTGDLVHIHQHTGNAGVGTIGLHIETEDTDIVPLKLSGARTYDIETDKGIWSETTISGADIIGTNVTDGTDPGHLHTEFELSGAVRTEVDPFFAATSGALTPYELSGAVRTEVDPVFGALSGSLAFYDVSGSAAVVQAELDALSGAHTVTRELYDVTSGAYTTHAADTSDPHGATLTQTNLSGTDIQTSGDHNTSGTAYVLGTIMGTLATPPAASGYPQGTVYFQHAA